MSRKRIREPREYFGHLIMPVSGGSAGIRWCARSEAAGMMLKADTLAGIKQLIREARK